MSSHTLIPSLRSLLGRKSNSDPFHDFRREMERFFEPDFPFARSGEFLSPSIDVKEMDDKFIVTAELPGLEEDDVDVSLSRNILTIKGEKKIEKEEKNENYHVSERKYGKFSRSFNLPYEIDPKDVDARFSKGILEITLPKSKDIQEQIKKIEIKFKE